jgi:hypothetical protein
LAELIKHQIDGPVGPLGVRRGGICRLCRFRVKLGSRRS